MTNRRRMVLAFVAVFTVVLLFDLGGIRTDIVNGFRDGYREFFAAQK